MPFLLFLLLLTVQFSAFANQPPLIAIASNFRPAMQQISQVFEQETGIKLRISYASSGILSQQISHGAPFEIFISANQRFINRLPRSLIRQQRVLAMGQLALLTSVSSGITLNPDLSGLIAAIKHRRLKHFAIANPNHTPFGLAARKALEKRQLWQTIHPILVTTENAAQAVHYVATGIAEAGLVPYSLALSPELQKTTRHILLGQNLQVYLPQTIALLKTAGRSAQRLYNFMQQPICRKILLQHGYKLPQESLNGLDRF